MVASVTPRGNAVAAPLLTYRSEEFVSCSRVAGTTAVDGDMEEAAMTVTPPGGGRLATRSTAQRPYHSGPEHLASTEKPSHSTRIVNRSADDRYQRTGADRYRDISMLSERKNSTLRGGKSSGTGSGYQTSAPSEEPSSAARRSASLARTQIPAGSSRRRTSSTAATTGRQPMDERPHSGRTVMSQMRRFQSGTAESLSTTSPILREMSTSSATYAGARPIVISPELLTKRPSLERQGRPSRADYPGYATLTSVERGRPPLYTTSSSLRGEGFLPSAGRTTVTRGSSVSRSRYYKDDTVSLGEGYDAVTIDPSKYSQEEVRRLGAAVVLRYLELKNYAERIHINDIARCQSTALYHSIMDFFFRQLGSPPCYDQLKFEDKVPRLYKDLGYPGTLAKSHMISPCTLSTWPQHLVALVWLASLLTLDDKFLRGLCRVSAPEQEATPCPIQTPRAIGGSRYTESYYQEDSHMAGRLTPYAPSTARLFEPGLSPSRFQTETTAYGSPTATVLHTIQTGYLMYRKNEGCIEQGSVNKIVDSAVAHIRSRLELHKRAAAAAYEEALVEYSTQEALFREIELRRSDLQRLYKDRELIRSAIDQNEKAYKEHTAKTSRLTTHSEANEARIAVLKKEIETLRERVRTQEISKEDVEPLIRKTRAQEERLKLKKDEKLALESERCQLESKIDSLRDELYTMARCMTQQVYAIQKSLLTSSDGGELLSARRQSKWLTPIRLDLSLLTFERLSELAERRFATPPNTSSHSRRELRPDQGSIPPTSDDTWDGSEDFIERIELLLRDVMGDMPWKDRLYHLESVVETEKAQEKECHSRLAVYEKTIRRAETGQKNKRQAIKALKDHIKNLEHDISVEQAKTSKLKAAKKQAEEESRRYMTSEDQEDERELMELQTMLDTLQAERDACAQKLQAYRASQTKQLEEWKRQMIDHVNATLQQITTATKVVEKSNSELQSALHAICHESECTGAVSPPEHPIALPALLGEQRGDSDAAGCLPSKVPDVDVALQMSRGPPQHGYIRPVPL